MEFENQYILDLLKFLRGHKNVPDLHSAVCKGRDILALECFYDGTFSIESLTSEYKCEGVSLKDAYDILVRYEVTSYEI